MVGSASCLVQSLPASDRWEWLKKKLTVLPPEALGLLLVRHSAKSVSRGLQICCLTTDG